MQCLTVPSMPSVPCVSACNLGRKTRAPGKAMAKGLVQCTLIAKSVTSSHCFLVFPLYCDYSGCHHLQRLEQLHRHSVAFIASMYCYFCKFFHLITVTFGHSVAFIASMYCYFCKLFHLIAVTFGHCFLCHLSVPNLK